MDAQNDLSQDQEGQGQAEEVLESVGVGVPTDSAEENENTPHMKGDGNQGTETNLPLGVKERLGRQEKRHQREIRQMREQLDAMHQMMSQPQQSNMGIQDQGSYGEGNLSVDDQIHKAVSVALAAQDAEKRKAKEREEAAHIHRKIQSLNENLDKASDKYEDFEDVVRAHDAPFTPAMRDAALFLDNAADVLYKLGKNKDELKRIAQLHPLDQAREMVKLSHALMSGGGNDRREASSSRPIGQIKSNPISSNSVTDKTSPADIRRLMKSGAWRTR